MAYVSANLNLMVGTLAGGPKIWDYFAGADAQTVVRVSGHFSDGAKRGILVGDAVIVRYTSRAMSIHNVVTATRGAPGANDIVDLTDGLAVPATNTD